MIFDLRCCTKAWNHWFTHVQTSGFPLTAQTPAANVGVVQLRVWLHPVWGLWCESPDKPHWIPMCFAYLAADTTALFHTSYVLRKLFASPAGASESVGTSTSHARAVWTELPRVLPGWQMATVLIKDLIYPQRWIFSIWKCWCFSATVTQGWLLVARVLSSHGADMSVGLLFKSRVLRVMVLWTLARSGL